MADQSQITNPAKRGAANIEYRAMVLFWVAIATSLVAALSEHTVLSNVVTVIGAVLATIAIVIRLGYRDMRNIPSSIGITELIAHDERAVLISDRSGHIVERNGAARQRYGDVGGNSLELLMDTICAQAGAVIFRLQSKAERQNAASEEVVTRKGRFMISAHSISEDRLFWSIEDVSKRQSPSRSLDKISLPMMTAGASGTILFMNEAMRRLVGGRVKSLNLLFAEVPEQSGAIASMLTEGGRVEMRVIMVPVGKGRIEYFLVPVEDGSSAVASLDTLEEFPVALLKVASDGAVREANKLARDLLGLEAPVGYQLSDLVEGLGRPIADWLADAAEGRSLHKPEVLKAKTDSKETYLQITLGRMIQDGEVSLLAMVTDATELKTLEAQFVQSQKMQAIGQLAGGVAHDFNNLLTAISGHCDLLMLRHDPGDPEYGDLEQINQNANRAASLVGQLLAFSRKQNLQLEVLDMRDTLADLTHLLNRLVGAQISLTLTHDPQLMSVRSDRRQLEQVIMNLVVNARDAMNGGGKISIETRNLKLQSELKRDRALVPRGDYVLVKVNDNGRGIPKDKIAKIFEPFFTTKQTGEGTGLGLSTAYGIVKQSGGYIFVDSEVGKGTTFTIFFPSSEDAVDQAPVRQANEYKIDPTPADGVVLLVEDEAPVRAFASRALKLRGFQVIEAENAEEALQVLAEGKMEIDVVVSDVVMPGMDGPTWVRLARETHPDLRVVFVSGYAEDSFGENQAKIPNTVFLPKPFSLNELTTVVQGQLQVAA